jgi:hypothetical protein
MDRRSSRLFMTLGLVGILVVVAIVFAINSYA